MRRREENRSPHPQLQRKVSGKFFLSPAGTRDIFVMKSGFKIVGSRARALIGRHSEDFSFFYDLLSSYAQSAL